MRNVSKTGKILAVIVSCAICLGIFLTVMLRSSNAKYAVSYNGYTEFHPASFNAAILGESYMTDDPTPVRKFRAFGADVSLANCFPGMSMTNDTAKEFPFTIANGNDDTDVSDIGIEYLISIRTTRNLPLKYYIKSAEDTLYYPGPFTEVTDITDDQTWYECRFYSVEAQAQQNDNNKFLDNLSGGEFNFNSYTLIIEWPDDSSSAEDNSVRYMKEVDMFEVYVTVSSVNRTPSDDDEPTPHDYHSAGIISVYGIADGEQFHDSYTLDYRAFNGSEFTFRVDNGYGETLTRSSLPKYLYYTVKLKVPYNTDTNGFTYSLSVVDNDDVDGDGDTTEYLQLYPIYEEYRLYDEHAGSDQYGTYQVLNASEAANFLAQETGTNPDLNHRLYKVCSYGWNPSDLEPGDTGYVDGPINAGLSGEAVPQPVAGDADSALFCIGNQDADGHLIYGERYLKVTVAGLTPENLADLAFDSKIGIITDAIYSDATAGISIIETRN